VAILLTGIPAGLIPGFQNSTGKVLADLLRLNVAIPPARSPDPLGLLGDDLAGLPNGRRVADDVVNASALTQGLTPGPDRCQDTFPNLGLPHDGYSAAP
jgi:hypothetical protein